MSLFGALMVLVQQQEGHHTCRKISQNSQKLIIKCHLHTISLTVICKRHFWWRYFCIIRCNTRSDL